MKHYSHILTLILWTFSCTNGYSTAQAPDRLIYKSDTISIYANPLEQLYEKGTLRPNFFGKKPGCGSTDCWRGYQAEWAIIENELYLTGIYSCCYAKIKLRRI
jgi:hypothetical protein